MLPKPYTVPTEGPVGRYLEAMGQHPWRPAHIHFKVTAPGHEPLVTQVFFPGDPYLENDTIGAVKEALVRPRGARGRRTWSAAFDIVLRPRPREPALRELLRSAGGRFAALVDGDDPAARWRASPSSGARRRRRCSPSRR